MRKLAEVREEYEKIKSFQFNIRREILTKAINKTNLNVGKRSLEGLKHLEGLINMHIEQILSEAYYHGYVENYFEDLKTFLIPSKENWGTFSSQIQNKKITDVKIYSTGIGIYFQDKSFISICHDFSFLWENMFFHYDSENKDKFILDWYCYIFIGLELMYHIMEGYDIDKSLYIYVLACCKRSKMMSKDVVRFMIQEDIKTRMLELSDDVNVYTESFENFIKDLCHLSKIPDDSSIFDRWEYSWERNRVNPN